jgi:hypothetical protein
MGALLKQVYERQLDGEVKTTAEAITLASQMLNTAQRESAEKQRF